MPVGVDHQYSRQSENKRKHDIPDPDSSATHPGQEKFKQHRRKDPSEGQHPLAEDFLTGPFPS